MAGAAWTGGSPAACLRRYGSSACCLPGWPAGVSPVVGGTGLRLPTPQVRGWSHPSALCSCQWQGEHNHIAHQSISIDNRCMVGGSSEVVYDFKFYKFYLVRTVEVLILCF